MEKYSERIVGDMKVELNDTNTKYRLINSESTLKRWSTVFKRNKSIKSLTEAFKKFHIKGYITIEQVIHFR